MAIADADVVKACKWRGTRAWSHDGMICTGESYQDKVKLTFAKGDALGQAAFKALFRQAVDLNSAGKSKVSEKRVKLL